ncbi:WbqC family protein, partial [Solidesulfovibrio sp.]|uniref:WbqC family protein n=1 Tax=Solidesulfovibrio sp. TaxID=2910990 RepID=UPI002B21928E
TGQGTQWLSIPVRHTGRFGQPVDAVRVADAAWTKKHWASLSQAYAKAPFFESLAPAVREVYEACREEEYLSAVNRRFIALVAGLLGLSARIVSSRDYAVTGDKNERLVELCRRAGAGAYLSGPAARDYLDETLFTEAGIGVAWMDYSGYPEYPQLHGPFVHAVSVLDLLFSVGPDRAKAYMRPLPREGEGRPCSR